MGFGSLNRHTTEKEHIDRNHAVSFFVREALLAHSGRLSTGVHRQFAIEMQKVARDLDELSKGSQPRNHVNQATTFSHS